MQKSTGVTIKGTSPLLMHAFPMTPIEAPEKLKPEEQARLAAYVETDSNALYVPAIALLRALVSGASYSKGKGRATLQRPAAACLAIAPEHLALGVTVKDYVVDARPVVVPATKGRVIRYRPRLDSWQLMFTVAWDDTLLSEDQVRRIIDDTGTRVGILDFRPEKKGPYGRYIVTHWVGPQ